MKPEQREIMLILSEYWDRGARKYSDISIEDRQTVCLKILGMMSLESIESLFDSGEGLAYEIKNMASQGYMSSLQICVFFQHALSKKIDNMFDAISYGACGDSLCTRYFIN